MRPLAHNLPIALLSLLVLLPKAQASVEVDCPDSYKVCFIDYSRFVANRARLKYQHGLKLDQYIPELCFLERLSTEQVSQLKNLELAVIRSVVPVKLEDIAPLFKVAEVKCFSTPEANCDCVCDPQCNTECEPSGNDLAVIPDELMVRFDRSVLEKCAGSALHLLAQLDPLGSREILEPSRDKEKLLKLIGFSGPEIPLDQAKLNVRLLKEFLLSRKVSLLSRARGGNDEMTVTKVLDLLGVTRIDAFEYATLRNGTTAGVIQSGKRDDPVFFRRGLRGQRQVLGLIDDYLDTDHCFLDDPQGDLPGPNHRKLVDYQPDLSGAPSLHGTFVAGILAGSSSKDPSEPNNGQAPEAAVSFTSVWDIAARGPIRTVLREALQGQYADGARIFSNSWGDSERGWYTNWAYDIDRFSREREKALVLFAVNNDHTVLSPENAKNVLAVGASKQADLENDLGRAGKGPTCDRQRKPEIFAPGCQIRSSIAGTRCEVGQAPIEHQHGSSAGLPLHGSSCATSWAAPAVAGAAALARQHLIQQYNIIPSGALLKATLLNGTRDMTGIEYQEMKYPNDIEGWGRLALDDALYLPDDRRTAVFFDVRNSYGLKPAVPPRVRRYRIKVKRSSGSSPPEELKVTLVWTDPPPAQIVRRHPLVNDLDLRVRKLTCRPGESCYFLGNNFSNSGESKPHATEPRRREDPNNVEQVLIKNPTGGDSYVYYCISVVGEYIHVPRQGFGLVVTGEVEKVSPTYDCQHGPL
jgi:subtilase family protein